LRFVATNSPKTTFVTTKKNLCGILDQTHSILYSPGHVNRRWFRELCLVLCFGNGWLGIDKEIFWRRLTRKALMKNQRWYFEFLAMPFAFGIIGLLCFLSSESRADKFIDTSRIFYTINPEEFGASGSPFSLEQISSNPMVDVDPTTGAPDSESKSGYITQVFQRILKNCHETMEKIDTLDTSDVGFYWAQVTGCLVVPYHESKLTHFRKILDLVNENDQSICSLRMNNGQFLSGNKVLFGLFLNAFKEKNVVKECSSYEKGSSYIQLVGSSDSYSTGIMQIAMNWHGPHVMAGAHLSMDETLKYGLEKYLKAMNRLRTKVASYPCLKMNKQVNYVNLIRSPWSGDYNAGNDSKSCRYSNPADPWAQNDKSFMSDLNNFLGTVSLYSDGLTGEDLAIFQIIQSSMLYYQNLVSNTKKAGAATSSELESHRAALMEYVGNINP
jgi:hypothetical protein